MLLTMGEVRVRFKRAKGTLIVLAWSSLSDSKVKDRWWGEDMMSL